MDIHSKIKALVIEDDAEMARVLERIITRKFPIEVDIAPDCASARGRLTELDYDLITLDYRLPDGAGLDLLDEITGGGRPHPPVIMVTGHGDEETAARSFRSRASGYVVKDAKLPELLIDAVEKALAEISLKRVEKELLEEKVFIEDALNGLPDLFAVVDTEGKFFRWNRKVSEITGYSDAEISRMNIVELFREEDRQKMFDGMQRLRQDGFAVDEVVLETRTGEQRFYELSGRLLRNYDGIPIGYSGIGRDITERVMVSGELARYRDELELLVEERTAELKEANERLAHEVAERQRAEEASRASESHFRSILENATDVIAILTAEGNIIDISPSIETILAYTPEQMKGRNVFEFIHPEDHERVLAVHAGVADGERESDTADCRFLHNDGSWHVLDVAGRLFQGAEGDARIIVSARDVTESRAREEALRTSEQRYRSMFGLIPDAICLIGQGGWMVEANETLLERSGLSDEDLRGMKYMDFFSSVDDVDLSEAAQELYAGRPVHGIQVPLRNDRGDVFYYEINAMPLIEEGELKSVLSLARDVTDRKRAEDELRMLNKELEGYAQTVSHDLRAPLTSIRLAAEHLGRLWEKRDEIDDLDAEVRRISEVLEASTNQAEGLIADLLSLARAGTPEEVEVVDVSATVERVLAEHDSLIAERGVRVTVAENLGKVSANPTHVYQVFSNLIDNAIRHNESDEPALEVNYLGNTRRGHVYLVKDNGPGIPPGDVENIFLPFFKGEGGYTGIGLTIVDKVVKLYGGQVRVYNNDGACFEFSLRDQ